jgi:AraC-like DNA-binding protein
MRQELNESPIVHTSGFTGFAGLRVVIRKGLNNGHFGTGQKGRPPRLSAVFPPGKPFEISYSDANGEVAFFEIKPRFVDGVVRRAGIIPIRLEGVAPATFLITAKVDHLCSLLVHEAKRGARLCPLYFESLATALVIAVVSQTDSLPPDAGTLCVRNQQIQKAISYIEANFGSKLSLRQIAAASHMSMFHFSRLFSRIVGVSPYQYLLQYRLRFAQKLLSLRGAQRSIADIAIESGFYDQAHFSRHFRRAFGKTPQAYRSEQKLSKRQK